MKSGQTNIKNQLIAITLVAFPKGRIAKEEIKNDNKL